MLSARCTLPNLACLLWLALPAVFPASARADETGYPVYTVAFSPQGKWLAAGGGIDEGSYVGKPKVSVGALRIFDTKTWKEESAFKDEFKHYVTQCMFADEDTVIGIAARFTDSKKKQWNYTGIGVWWLSVSKKEKTRDVLVMEGKDKPGPAVAYHWQSGLACFAGGFFNGTGLRNIHNDPKVKQRNIYYGHAGLLCFSADGKRLLLGPPDRLAGSDKFKGSPLKDCVLRLFETDSGKILSWFNPDGDFADAAAFSPDGKLAVFSCQNEKLYVLSADLKKTINVFPVGHSSRLLAISPDSRYVATKAATGTVKILDLDNGKDIKTFDQHDGGVNSIAFSPDGALLAVGCGTTSRAEKEKIAGTVRVWDIKTGQSTCTLKF